MPKSGTLFVTEYTVKHFVAEDSGKIVTENPKTLKENELLRKPPCQQLEVKNTEVDHKRTNQQHEKPKYPSNVYQRAQFH